MRIILGMIVVAACAPDVQSVPDAAIADADSGLCAMCDPANEYCLGPVTVARLAADDCHALPPSCDACECVVASLATDTCPSPTCTSDAHGLIVVKCGAGP